MADPYEYQKWLEQQLQLEQQQQMYGQYSDPNGNYWNSNPDGSIPGAEVQMAPPTPGLGAPVGGAVGLTGGHALVNALSGGGGAPSSAAAGAAPSAPNILSAGAVPSTPNIVSAGFAPSSPTLMGSTTAGAALPYAGIAAGAYTGAQQASGVNDFFQGKPLDIKQQAALALPTFGASFLANPIQKAFGIGHSKNYWDAEKRDKGIQHLIDIGFLTPTETEEGGTAGVLDLPDGNTYTIGGDEHTNTVGPDGKTLHAYDVDFSQKGVGGIVAAINPIAAYLAKGDSKLTKDFAGYFTRAALAGGDPMKNVFALYKRLGMNHDQIYGAIHLMSENGDLDKETADAYKNGLDQLYGVGAYEGKGEQFGDPNVPTTATPKPQAAPQPAPAAPQPVAQPPQPAPQQVSPRAPLTAPPPRVPRDLLVKLGAAAGNVGTPVKLKPKTLLSARNR